MKNKVVPEKKYCMICKNTILATYNVTISEITLFLCDNHYKKFLEQEKIVEQFDIEDYGSTTTEY